MVEWVETVEEKEAEAKEEERCLGLIPIAHRLQGRANPRQVAQV